jgi:hypothetical protein
MKSPRPTTLKTINQNGAVVRIFKDEREPFGSIKISLNEAGLDMFYGLIEAYSCNAIEILYHGISKNKITHFLKPSLEKVSRPYTILDLQIAEAGAFAPDFDFKTLRAFNNVRSFTILDIPMDALEYLFPNLEVLRIFQWKKNKVEYRRGLWPNLRCLHLASFRGDLSIFEGWDIRSLFLDSSIVEPFSSIQAFPNLETLRADHLGSDVDLAALSSLQHLRNVRLQKPRRAPMTVGFSSRSIEMMVLEKIEHIDLAKFLSLKIYGIDLKGARGLAQWNGFEEYGDPFAAVHFRRFPLDD